MIKYEQKVRNSNRNVWRLYLWETTQSTILNEIRVIKVNFQQKIELKNGTSLISAWNLRKCYHFISINCFGPIYFLWTHRTGRINPTKCTEKHEQKISRTQAHSSDRNEEKKHNTHWAIIHSKNVVDTSTLFWCWKISTKKLNSFALMITKWQSGWWIIWNCTKFTSFWGFFHLYFDHWQCLWFL